MRCQSEPDEMTEEEQRNIPEDVEERLETFKQQKAKAKTNFTRARHKLLALIDDDHPPRRSEMPEECRKLDTALEKAMCYGEPFGGIFASRRLIQSKKARERNRTTRERIYRGAE